MSGKNEDRSVVRVDRAADGDVMSHGQPQASQRQRFLKRGQQYDSSYERQSDVSDQRSHGEDGRFTASSLQPQLQQLQHQYQLEQQQAQRRRQSFEMNLDAALLPVAKSLHCIDTQQQLMKLIRNCDVDDYDILRLRAMPLDFLLRCYLCDDDDSYHKGIEALKQHRLIVHRIHPDTYSVYKCFNCQHMTSSASKLKGHLEECGDLSVSLGLVTKCLVVTDMNAFTQDEAEKVKRKA